MSSDTGLVTTVVHAFLTGNEVVVLVVKSYWMLSKAWQRQLLAITNSKWIKTVAEFLQSRLHDVPSPCGLMLDNSGKIRSKCSVCNQMDTLVCSIAFSSCGFIYNDVIRRKHFSRYWPFVRGIHRSPVNSPHNGQWRGALVFCLIFAWTKVE